MIYSHFKENQMYRVIFEPAGNNRIESSSLFKDIGDSFFRKLSKNFEKEFDGEFAGYISINQYYTKYSTFEPLWQYTFNNEKLFDHIFNHVAYHALDGYRILLFRKLPNENEKLVLTSDKRSFR